MTTLQKLDLLNDLVRRAGMENLSDADRKFFFAEGTRLVTDLMER